MNTQRMVICVKASTYNIFYFYAYSMRRKRTTEDPNMLEGKYDM